MSNVDFGPLNVQLRVKEMELLDQTFFQQLIESSSMESVLKALQGTTYNFIKDSTEIEPKLKDYVESFYHELFELSPDPKIIEFATLKYTYHNLKVLFKNYYQEKDLMHLTVAIGRYNVEELNMAVKTGQSEILPEIYMNAIHEIQAYMEETDKIQHIDILLDYEYMNHLFELSEEIGEPITTWTKEYIDLNRIIVAFRLLNLNKPVSSISGLIPDIGYLKNSELVDASKNGAESLTKVLLESEYGTKLSNLLDGKASLDPIKIEKYLDNYFMDQLQQAKFESFGELPVLAYIYAKETEIKNIRVILNGIKNNILKELILASLRENYN